MRFLLVLVVLSVSYPAAGIAAESSQLTFVSEYVRQLRVNENNRELAEKEIAERNADRFAAMIRGSTRIVLELTAQVQILKDMRLKKPFDQLPENIAKFYGRKIELHNSIIEMATVFMSGPKPGVDYGAMTADAPKITAMIEYVDRALFEATPLIFATLIDEKPDRNGHTSRLTITRTERDKLVQTLQASFGKKLDQENQNFIISSATVLRDYLSKKGYKCSDEPL